MSIGSLVTESHERQSTALNCAHHDALYGERRTRIAAVLDQGISAQPPDILRYKEIMLYFGCLIVLVLILSWIFIMLMRRNGRYSLVTPKRMLVSS